MTATTVGGPRDLPVTGSDSAPQLWFTAFLIALVGVLDQLTRRRLPQKP